MSEVARAFAPATVANVGIGFDILGHAVQAVGDYVTASRSEEPGVHIRSVTGTETALPLDPACNTAGRAVMALWAGRGERGGIDLDIEKGIPLSSGLGGSAASAVAAVVAVNALLPEPVDKLTLLRCAAVGEQVASHSMHLDNVSASLFGGLVLTVGLENPRVTQIPVPAGIQCVLVRPHLRLNTRDARGLLSQTVTLSDFVWQTANLAGFISGCYSGDLNLIREAFLDVVIEPQRKGSIPGFRLVRAAGMSAGALGCSISGAGPTVFAWCEASRVEAIRTGMIDAFAEHEMRSDSWITAIDSPGAHIVESCDDPLGSLVYAVS